MSARASAPPEASPVSARGRTLLVLLITAVAVVLRFWDLGERSLWIDEVLTVDRARSLDSIGYLRWTPTHLLVRAAFELFGVSEWSARLAPALIGSATIPILYVLLRRVVDQQVALATAGLFAVCPWHIYWSQCSRGYAALLLLYGVGLILLYEGFETRRLRLVLGAGVLLMLATLERRFTVLNAGLTVGALAVFHWIRGAGIVRERRRELSVILAILCGIGLTYELVAAVTAREGILEEFLKFRGIGPIIGSREMLRTLVDEMGLPLLVLAALGTLCAWPWKTRDVRAMAAAAWTPVLAVLVLTRYARIYDRYAFVALPFLCLLTGHLLTRLLGSRRGPLKLLGLLAALWFGVVTVSQIHAHHAGHGRRLDWRPPLRVVREQHVAGDVLFFSGKILARHYVGRDIEVRWSFPGAHSEDWLPAARRVWFLLPSEVPARSEAWLEEHASRVEVDPAGGGQLWIYVPPGRRR